MRSSDSAPRERGEGGGCEAATCTFKVTMLGIRGALTGCSSFCCCLQDVPTAYAYELEAATIVQSSQVVEAVERLAKKVAYA